MGPVSRERHHHHKGYEVRRRAAKIDNNQNMIVDALRGMDGVTVQPGHDDLLVGYRGKTYWYEVKSEKAVSKRTGKIREKEKKKSQIKLEETWRGHYRIISSLDEILNDITS